MNEKEKEKEEIELDIEAKYVNETEKEFLNGLTYEECIYILKPENNYCDEIIELSLLKLCEIIENLQKENEELLEVKVSASAHNRILELEKENEELKARLDELSRNNFPIIY